jgi:hypothetical protein
MSFIIYKDEREPAMLYEAIACYTFNCDRLEDPEGIADAGFFDANFVPPLTQVGLCAMHSILDELISNEGNESKIQEYKGIKNSLALGMDQDNSIQLLGLIADLINEQ